MRTTISLGLAAALVLAAMGLAEQSKGHWQKPGEIQQPKGTWQKPGEIQVPKGIQAIHAEQDKCQSRLTVGADALFEFNQATLTEDARETLTALGPMIQKAGKHPIVVEGHTDAVGTAAYNMDLSERRAKAVREWLVAQHYLDPASSTVQAFGKTKPAAPNTNADGTDNPAGRQKNRRVEVVIDTCK